MFPFQVPGIMRAMLEAVLCMMPTKVMPLTMAEENLFPSW